MIHEKAITTKRTTRTGKAAGKRSGVKISIAINDPDRVISKFWEEVKRFYSLRNQTAAETARSVFLNGLAVMLHDIANTKEQSANLNNKNNQAELFQE